MVSLGGYVKIMLTYDIIPQMAEDYYEFMLGELVPAVESMGLTMSEVWHTAAGNYPLRLITFVADDRGAAEHVLACAEFYSLEERLMNYVSNYSLRMVPLRDHFQF